MDEWVHGFLSNQFYKDWEPELVASPDVAGAFPTIDGMAVEADDAIPDRTLQIRCKNEVVRDDYTVKAGEVMAQYTGVDVPVPKEEEDVPDRLH